MQAVIRHHHAMLNGFDMHYASCGEPGHPLLLFVHGFPQNWQAWHHQLEAFGPHYYAVALDTRGVNESAGPVDVKGYRAGHMVADILALIDHLGYPRCVLVGHDWGGAIACAVALAQPARLHGLVMINAVHPAIYRRELVESPAQQAASAYMNFFISDGALTQICANDFAYLFGMFAEDGQQPEWLDARTQADYRHSWSRPGSVRAGLNYYRASPLHPAALGDSGAAGVVFDPAAMTLSVPTLVIWGERDRFLLTGCLDGLKQFAPDLRIERIPDGSHWIIHEHGPRVNRLITEFLNDRLDTA
ncbi:alpha/beta hydrolase [Cupriavidus necator]|uniref:alpha/beta fold hydrolase n=1 Tax=Cupriavidus necator TaxID=106590 RepID=UPI003ED06DF6